MKIGDVTPPLVEAWKRFAAGNATREDFNVILADLLDFSLHGKALSFAVFQAEKPLADFPLYAALVASKQELGQRIISLLNYDDNQLIEIKRLARSAIKRNA
jgi:hypothetical protein